MEPTSLFVLCAALCSAACAADIYISSKLKKEKARKADTELYKKARKFINYEISEKDAIQDEDYLHRFFILDVFWDGEKGDQLIALLFLKTYSKRTGAVTDGRFLRCTDVNQMFLRFNPVRMGNPQELPVYE